MAYSSRPTSIPPPRTSAGTSLRQPSNHSGVSQPSSALAARIAAKKAELDNLKQLRDLSGALAMQMQAMEHKLSTLKDGTEAVACVLSNWDNVLRAISMASTKAANIKVSAQGVLVGTPLPATLVRIPAEESEKTCE